MPSLRESIHDDLTMVVVLGPAAPVPLAALEGAIEAHILSADGAELRRRRRPAGGWGRVRRSQLPGVLAGVVVHHPAGLTPAALALAAAETGFGVGLPITAHVSGDLVAFASPHDLLDGHGGFEHLARILGHACGAVAGRRVDRTARYPLVEAVLRSPLRSPSGLALARATRRAAERAVTAEPTIVPGLVIDRDRRLRGHRFVPLAAAEVETILRNEGLARGRATPAFRLTAFVLAALDRSLHRAGDIPLRIGIDLRRYLPPNVRVLGPFSTAYPLGMLRTGDRSAAALTERVRSALRVGAPLVALVGNLAGYVRGGLRHPLAREGDVVERSSLGLYFTVVPDLVPDAFWAEEGARKNGVFTYHPTAVTDPFVQIAILGAGAVVSVWDETGTVDLDAFERAVHDLVRGSAGADEVQPSPATPSRGTP